MKKFIILGAALATLLFSFISTVDVTDVNFGVSVCEDSKPSAYPYD